MEVCCNHRLIIFIYSLWLQVPNFTDSLCYQQILNVKMPAQARVLALALALDEGKAEARAETGQTRQSMWVHEILWARNILGSTIVWFKS